MKLAFVRLSSLGDIILCMASLQLVRRAYPDCRITWITDRRFGAILEDQPDIDRLVTVDLKSIKKRPGIGRLMEGYRLLDESGPFDAVIDLHGMIKSALAGALAGGDQYGFARRSRKEALAGLWYKEAYTIPTALPAMVRYLNLAAAALSIEYSAEAFCPPKPFLFWKKEDEAVTDPYLTTDPPTVVFVPGTSAPYKNYPPKRFAVLADLLQVNILICHGNDQEYRAALAVAERSNRVTVLPRLSIGELKALIGRVALVIGGDSGPTHIALGCGVPSITLFGATPVCFPPNNRNRVIVTDTIPNPVKPDVTDYSVTTISEQEIFAIANDLLSGSA